MIINHLSPSIWPSALVAFCPLKAFPSFMQPGWRQLHTLFPSTRNPFSIKGHINISASSGRGPYLLLSTDMVGWCSHKISCIFGAIDRMAAKNADFERSRAVLKKCDIVLHQHVVQRGVRADRKLLMANGDKEDGWRAVSQYQLYLRRYLSCGNKKCRFRKITSSLWKTRCSITPECRLTPSYSWWNEDLKITDCECRHGLCHSGVSDDGCCCCCCYCCCCFVLQLMRSTDT